LREIREQAARSKFVSKREFELKQGLQQQQQYHHHQQQQQYQRF